ncbi:hypothetical protein [Mycolicibacterium elephantis]|uniref:Uncharacterized protein n=1 Tax=Mycolicibacterium elephantis DSM 44368 TaxID=1335622 RepID=A0A439E0M2_9MYCO|nr:hypothetical protein [Mycolicibacterium elephantis]MCV7221528.1 hypothetical protein [Mycolicibacterium elephantis]RWA23970.1 hypothetical protein MELE44368_01800 [Mycolicibacterium elephantis DSM 44368]
MSGPLADTDSTARTITEAPAYLITADGEVWSRPRTVAGKAGSLRVLQARRLKPDGAGRVSLRIDGATVRMPVAALFRRYWPEIGYRKVQFCCRRGHPLIDENVAVWGTGNRVCRICWPDWHPPPKTQNHAPGRETMRVAPRSHPEVDDLTASAHGWQIKTLSGEFPRGEFPRVRVMPRKWVSLLCEVAGTPWGGSEWSPGCLSPMVGVGAG